MKQKYKYEIDATLDHKPNKPLYRLKTIKAGKEITKVVGIGQLHTMHQDGRICGHIPPYLKEKMGLPRRKTRKDKKGYVEPVNKPWQLPDSFEVSALYVPHVWNLPNEFKIDMSNGSTIEFSGNSEPIKSMELNHPATGRAYLISREDGRYCVVMPDGTLDEDWTPLNLAEMYMNVVNKELDNK